MSFPESAGDLETAVLAADTSKKTWFDYRCARLKSSPKFVVPISSDFFTCPKYLVPGINLRIRLALADPNFYLVQGTASAAGTYRIVFKKLELAIRYVVVNQKIKDAVESKFKQGQEAIYSFPFGKITTHVIPSGVTSTVVNQVCRGELPSTMLVGFVGTEELNGTKITNPLLFKPNAVSELYFDIMGNTLPVRPYQPDWEDSNGYGGALREYNALKDVLMLNENYVIPISYQDFKSHWALFAADISGHLTNSMHQALSKTGTVNVHVSFSQAPSKPLHMIVYSVYHRNVYIAAPDGPKLVSVDQSNYLDKRH